MNNQEIVLKLWNLCNILRDDGITYHQYVTELTYILFLKMAKETGKEEQIPVDYRWDVLLNKSGQELKKFYKQLLNHLGKNCNGRIQEIYIDAISNIDDSNNLKKIINSINLVDWYSAQEEGLGNLYEGLLEKNANEKKSGAGQYFTPRALIDVITRLVAPQPGEKCNDPACGTFGFMIAADRFVKDNTNNLQDLPVNKQRFQIEQAFTGCELVRETHKLALMNAMLHGIEGNIMLGDSLSDIGKQMRDYDVILTNPPFGSKNGGERSKRNDFTYQTSNKQLNFLQHIYLSLKASGKARAAVIVPDNVLFVEGDGEKIRSELMEKCNLHTILRLPTKIFYAQGVKTNVLFFTRGKSNKNNTKEVWFYDLRTNMPSLGRNNQLKVEHFIEFEKAYIAKNRDSMSDIRWSCYKREDIKRNGNSLDLGLIRDESVLANEELPDPIESGEDIISQLEEAVDLLKSVVRELKSLEVQD